MPLLPLPLPERRMAALRQAHPPVYAGCTALDSETQRQVQGWHTNTHLKHTATAAMPVSNTALTTRARMHSTHAPNRLLTRAAAVCWVGAAQGRRHIVDVECA